MWFQINTDKHSLTCLEREVLFLISLLPTSLYLSLSPDATAVITPTKEHKDMSGLERFEPLLEGVHLTTNLLYDPVGPSGLSETPSGHSCPPQLQLKSIRTGVVLKGLEP